MFNRILNRIVSFDKKKGGGRFNYGVKMRSTFTRSFVDLRNWATYPLL
jgi:hypothetical protein